MILNIEITQELIDKYNDWVHTYNPDDTSRLVLNRLMERLLLGDPMIFEKFKQLERDECYRLCAIFKSMFDYTGLNEWYLNYIENENRRN